MDDKKILKSRSKVSSESSSRETTSFIVYILRTSSNTLYVGQTKNLEKRLKQHASHTSLSARYMRMFSSFELVYSESFFSRAESMKREGQLKKWSRAKKEALLKGNSEMLKKL